MDQQLAAEILTSDSDEISDLKANLDTLEGFINLIREIDALPDIKSRFYEESRSLYQTTAIGRNISELEKILEKFFGAAVKPAAKALPRKLRKSSVVKYLGGIQKDQSLFTVELKTGQFYGALWPWRRNKTKIEIHLGYCSDWMSDEDYIALETFVHQTVSRGTFANMDAGIGGQIHGISLPSFLQMSEMEKSSFSLRVTSLNRVGALHIADGNLFAAEFDDLTGCDAAYRIISWDEASIDIEPLNTSKGEEIKMPLMHVLMESLKLKDEAAAVQEKPPQPKGRVKAKKPPEKKTPSNKRLVRLERAHAPMVPRKKKRMLALVGISVGIFAVLAAIGVVTYYILENRSISDGYAELIAKVERVDEPATRIDLLEKYLEKNPKSPYGAQIQSRILDARNKIEERAFEEATLSVSGLPLDENYEAKAIEIFSRFLEEYPNSRYTEEVNQSIAEIKNLLDQYYYEELKRAAMLDFNKRLDAYRKYLSQFPDGKYRSDVEVLINNMGEKYLAFLYEEAKACEKSKRWESCIKHANNFIEAYAGLGLSKEAQLLKTQLNDKREYYQLLSDAEDAGTNYRKAYQQFKAYLDSHPDSTQREKINKDLARLKLKINEQEQWLTVQRYANNSRYDLKKRMQKLDRYIKKNINGDYAGDAQSLLERLEEERLISLKRHQIESRRQGEQLRLQREQQELERRKQRAVKVQAALESRLSGSSRYRVNGDGTFDDMTTGLTWALLDSYQDLAGCINYDEAVKYVQSLRIGRHRAWRLPTAYELAAINKKSPYFPASGANWYWSSETSVKGYHAVADVVTATHESKFQREQRAVTECGAVRAVQIPQP